jgi:dienelactone hydrolase
MSGGKMLRFSAIALFTFIAGVANAQTARLEIRPIGSVTLTDQDFLGGRESFAAPAMIGGELRLPKSSGNRLPAVILLHGSGGLGGSGAPIDEWSKIFNQLGIATFAVDSFAGRNITSTQNDQTQLGRLNMVVDAYRALELLAKDPRIDPARIAVMGFSRGGQSALFSAMKRLYRTQGPKDGVQFAAHIAFYPDCVTTYREDTEVTDRPIRILHGTADNYNPVTPCRDYVERLTKANRDVKLIEYAEANHVFDSPALRSPVVLTNATTNRRCRLVEDSESRIINTETRQPFTYGDACVEKGPTLAFNEAAYTQAHAYVKDFLSDLFKLHE